MKNTHPESYYVQRCLQQIESNLGWGDSRQWHNEVFAELSQRIQEETNVLLSTTTLKRVWGRVTYDSAPSITTLNALAQLSGAANWREFKLQHQDVGITKPVSQEKSHLFSPHLGLVFGSAALMTVLFISLFSMIGVHPEKWSPEDLANISFSSHPVTKGLPNSVVFDLDLNNLPADSFSIQQYWDPTKTIAIHHEQKQATGIYYYPGHFRAKLKADADIIREHDLFIRSEGWLGTLDYQPVPKYLSQSRIFNEKLKFPIDIIEELESLQKPIQTSFHLVDDFRSVSADHFSLSTTIKSTYNEKWAVCQKTRIVILGTKGAIIIPFSIPGCVSDIGLMLNDVYLAGKENDLSMFGIDLLDAKAIDISIINKEVTVSVDDNEIFNGSYHESVGQLVGLRYRFIGAGQVEHLSVRDEKNNVLDGISF